MVTTVLLDLTNIRLYLRSLAEGNFCRALIMANGSLSSICRKHNQSILITPIYAFPGEVFSVPMEGKGKLSAGECRPEHRAGIIGQGAR